MKANKTIFLWGMPGVGKSTTGKALANVLGIEFIDLDKQIERLENKSVAAIFESKGEDYFRTIEQQFLNQNLAMNAVIAAGGGTPCFYGNAEKMLENGCCIYLEANAKMLVSRLKQAKQKRPLLAVFETDDALENALENTLKERTIFYSKAHLSAQALNIDVKQLAVEIEAWFNSYR
jgi:shikimate kinase